MQELKDKELLEEGEMVDIPDLENHDLIEESISSVIVNGLNPLVHKIGGLVKTLPPIYELEDCVRGRRMDCCSRSMDTKPQSRFLVQDPFWIRLEIFDRNTMTTRSKEKKKN